MTTKLSMLIKQAALAVCCAASLGAMPLAYARTSVGISVGAGPAYYDGYYNSPARCYYDYWGNYRCRRYPTYDYAPYYSPGITLGYYDSWGHHHGNWRGHSDWHGSGHHGHDWNHHH